MIGEVDIAYIAGLIDGEGIFNTNNTCENENTIQKHILPGP